MTTEAGIEATDTTSIDAINEMSYQEMLDAWVTGSLDLVPGTPESDAFNARFQKLRAETPTEDLNGTSDNTRRNAKTKKKAGKYHGKRR